MTGSTLHPLFDAHQHLPPEYAGGMSNHLPMAAHALHALGADAARLAAFAQRYVQRFTAAPVPAPTALSTALNTTSTTASAISPAITSEFAPEFAPKVVPAADWRALRGQPNGHAPLLAHFQHALATQGRDAVLRAALPDLLPGLAAAAFHGLIRVAHAAEAAHTGELAAGLAYWAWRWKALPAPTDTTPLPFDDWSRALVSQAPGCICEGTSFATRMHQATASPQYLALAGRLAPAPDLLRRLSGFAAGRYAATRNLLVLHMLTATRAWRVLQPWLPAAGAPPTAQAALIHALIHALTAAYLAARIPQGLQLAAPQPSSWGAVIAAAIRSDDDHVIKLVHACRDEAAVYGEGAYLAAARRAVSARPGAG